MGSKVAPPPRGSWAVPDFRTRVFASKVPAAPGPRASAGSSVLRGVGQQMALQGLELQRPHPMAAGAGPGCFGPATGAVWKEGLPPACKDRWTSDPCGDCQPCLGEGVRARVSWCRHRRTCTLGLRFGSRWAVQGACSSGRTQPGLRMEISRTPSLRVGSS